MVGDVADELTYASPGQHTAADTAANIDPARVQQAGDQALGLARALGSQDLLRHPAERIGHGLDVIRLQRRGRPGRLS